MTSFPVCLWSPLVILSNKYTKIPSNSRTVRQEIIWRYQHIKFKNKSLIYLNWINDGIIFINDIVDHEGKLSENFILKKNSLKTNWISEFTLKIINSGPNFLK
jgi:hypothetical protein